MTNTELGLVVLLFIMYLGVIWLTLNQSLRRIEKLLTPRKPEDNEDERPSSEGKCG